LVVPLLDGPERERMRFADGLSCVIVGLLLVAVGVLIAVGVLVI
jgi:hypothetical protein